MKLRIGNVDIECTVSEAVELLTRLQEPKATVPFVIQIPPAFQPPYVITCGSTNTTDLNCDANTNLG